ncbi:hypothetical protein THIX_70184 [Thiomonas sp. X19]|uniref:hypothetical protein n=1 Tax=Thiomonas sp. X19 TaxID=1050370 RepID=UPI000B64F193|nr:hypothetical protein [Thiomonas sp. X19]SCC95155.1 hypothetical protein THIX_70184 [Thiomonas sp. X19]
MSTSTLYNPEQSTSSTRINVEALHPSRGQKAGADELIVRLVAEEFKVSQDCVLKFIAHGYRP